MQDKHTSNSPLSNSQLCATVMSQSLSLILLRLNIHSFIFAFRQ